MKRLAIYIHGKGGNAGEAAHYQPLFATWSVVGMAYHAQTPWEACQEFPRLFDQLAEGYDDVALIAGSIGAYFAMLSLADKPISQAYLISPVVDMERLITDMMGWARVTEEELRRRGVIATDFGEPLKWEYLCYAREHPIAWRIPTHILYAGQDHLTTRETITAFAVRTGATLTVMEAGEHWFHTPEQMAFLDAWVNRVRDAGEA
ncbi:MAG: alpha/beta hydrolase [Clostridiales bacterium]|nr:alpha/beta hydrolase [Clostridiales bacterium]